MAYVFFNQIITFSKERAIIWSAQNDATCRFLRVINKIVGLIGESTEKVECQLGIVEEDNQSIIFLNPPEFDDDRTLGVFLNDTYGYEVVEGSELFSAVSVGGYGNSSSKFGIYEVGTLLKCHTYKYRRPATYFKLYEDGWKKKSTISYLNKRKVKMKKAIMTKKTKHFDDFLEFKQFDKIIKVEKAESPTTVATVAVVENPKQTEILKEDAE